MTFIAFNAFGPGLDAGDLDDAARSAGFDVFHAGQPMELGTRLHQQCGIGMSLEPAEDSAGVCERMTAFVDRNHALLSTLKGRQVTSRFVLGMTVGSAEVYVGCLELPPEALKMLARFDIGLDVMGYPTSDD